MKRRRLRFEIGFRVALANRRSQAAEMTLAPGASEGGPENRHRGSDQWLFIVSGTGTTVVNGKRYPLRAAALVLIERGDTHEIRNTGRTPLRTLNFYVPPAYSAGGNPRTPVASLLRITGAARVRRLLRERHQGRGAGSGNPAAPSGRTPIRG